MRKPHSKALHPKALVGALLALALLPGAAFAQATQPAGGKLPGASIQFDEEAWNFGEIDMGAIAKHTWSFTNTGDKPLIVTEAKSSCGCTVPSFSKDPIQPGGRGTIEVSFNSRGRRGPQHKSVTVKSNDPNRPIVQLTVRGTVAAPDAGDIQVQPMRLDFGLVNSGAFMEKEVAVRNVGKKPLNIQQVTGAPTELNAFIEGPSSLPPGGSAKIIVTLQPGPRTKGGYYERYVNIRSDDPMKPTMRIPCVAYIKADRGPKLLTVIGEIDVGTVDEPGKKLIDLPIVNTGDAPLTISRVQVAGVAVRAEGADGLVIQPGSSAFISIHAQPNLHQGTFRDRLLIYADDNRLNPQAPSQSLTVFGYVVKSSWNQGASNPQTPNAPNQPKKPGHDHR